MKEFGIYMKKVLHNFFQYKLLGKSVDSRGSQWLQKCRENKEQLKSLYLTALYDKEKGTKYFFGDWFQVLGISDTAYYLGAEFINVPMEFN